MSAQLGESVILSRGGVLHAAVVSGVNSCNNVTLCVFERANGPITLHHVPYSANGPDTDNVGTYCYPQHTAAVIAKPEPKKKAAAKKSAK